MPLRSSSASAGVNSFWQASHRYRVAFASMPMSLASSQRATSAACGHGGFSMTAAVFFLPPNKPRMPMTSLLLYANRDRAADPIFPDGSDFGASLHRLQKVY